MAFETIDYAEPKWAEKINNNFRKVITDSGWQSLTILAPATGSLVVRLYNGVLFFAGAIIPNATGDVTVASGLLDSSATFPVTDINTGGVVGVRVDSSTRDIILKGITSANASHSFAFDGNNIFVGTWAQLGGGVNPV